MSGWEFGAGQMYSWRHEVAKLARWWRNSKQATAVWEKVKKYPMKAWDYSIRGIGQKRCSMGGSGRGLGQLLTTQTPSGSNNCNNFFGNFFNLFKFFENVKLKSYSLRYHLRKSMDKMWKFLKFRFVWNSECIDWGYKIEISESHQRIMMGILPLRAGVKPTPNSKNGQTVKVVSVEGPQRVDRYNIKQSFSHFVNFDWFSRVKWGRNSWMARHHPTTTNSFKI